MSRTTNNDPEFTLEDYADHYIRLKNEAKQIDDELKAVNTRMKQFMKDEDVTEAHGKNGVVKYVIQHRESFDEEKAIKILKKTNSECIKTKEYIDSDILENELYNKKLPAEAMAALDTCRTVKDVVTLTIGKAGK